MSPATISDRVKSLIIAHLGLQGRTPDSIATTASLRDDLGVDSLDSIELAMACEDNFGITIPDDDVKKLKTVGDVVRLIEARAGAA